MTPKPIILANPTSLGVTQYATARELIDQAVLDLDKTAPINETNQDGTIRLHAHLARAALDRLAEEAIFYDRETPKQWADLARIIGLTPQQAKQLVHNHLDPPDQPLWPEDN